MIRYATVELRFGSHFCILTSLRRLGGAWIANELRSRTVQEDFSETVATIGCVAGGGESRGEVGRHGGHGGFSQHRLARFAPKLAKGEIASLSGPQDDARYFQISVPVQPGNSGGALVDERGNVVGVVSAKLSVSAALKTSGALPENVNYAIKSSYLLSFLESVPEVSTKLKEPNTKERKFEDVVKDAEQAAVLVLVY